MKSQKKHSGRKPPRDNACTNKKPLYEAEAYQLIDSLYRTQGAVMNAYRCRHGCTMPDGSPAWHIGHANPRQ